MPQQDQWYPDVVPTTSSPTSGLVEYEPFPPTTRRALDMPSPTRTTSSSARPRERRGSRRHSTRGGPDEGDNPADPEPSSDQAGRRFCAGCGRSIDHLRAHAETCSPRCRQRKRRHVDPLNQGLDADPYLRLSGWEHEALRGRALAGCRCNGHHVLDPDDGTCFKCGHPRDWRRWGATAAIRLVQARSVEREHDRPLEQVIV